MSRSRTGTSLRKRERRPRPGWAALEIISDNFNGCAPKNKEWRGRLQGEIGRGALLIHVATVHPGARNGAGT
jgi:hypothetical protein